MTQPIVTLPSGRYVGVRNPSGTLTFQNIPYGTFRGRWKPLGPVEPGDERHDASRPGPACPQIPFGPYPQCQAEYDEAACFTLSVSTADLGGKKPVYVYIHGGANVSGGYFDPRIQTAGFVDRHPDLVCVTFNYRLGILGTLCLDGLTDESAYRHSGNLSTLDQIAALEWVRQNIAAFGGDADNVTIGGQSSGCASVKQLFLVPRAWPLFRRAICQSGTTLSRSRPLTGPEARAAAARTFDALGMDSLEGLLGLDTARLLSVSPFELGLAAVEDDITLPTGMNERLCGGDEAALVRGKDILIGCMNGDMDGFAQDADSLERTKAVSRREIAEMLQSMPQGVAELYVKQILPGVSDVPAAARRLRAYTEGDAERLFELYSEKCPGEEPFLLVSDCLNDFLMYNPLALESSGLCKHNNVYLYLWDWAPKSLLPRRAVHAMDVPFVFAAPHELGALPEEERREAEAMYAVTARVWGDFLRTGIPDPTARPFAPDTMPTLRIDRIPRTEDDPRRVSRICLTEWLREQK
ncbi:MAG: carboxylesterase/lipase family protein [Oscillospiraceae bacterium]|nr:carboxylesterase/lipase family protein [Oscillospiraceae bacterium]